MSLDVTRRDVVWSYLNLGLTNGVNLLLLPLMLVYLSAEELGLWFVFSAVGTLVVVLDLGLMVTFSRQVTYAWCGARELRAVGFVEDLPADGKPNYTLLTVLLATLRTTYWGIALVALAVAGTFGTWHVISSAHGELPAQEALAAWGVYLVAVFLNTAFAYWMPVLRGVGAVAQSHQANVVGKLLQFMAATVFLVAGAGLWGVCVAYLVSTFLARALAARMFVRYRGIGREDRRAGRVPFGDVKKTLRVVSPNVGRQGMVSISQYAMMTAPVLIASGFLSLEKAAMVGLAMQVMSLVRVFSNGLFNAYLPLFARLRLEGDQLGLARIFARSLGVSTYIVLAGGVAMAFVAPPVLDLLGADVSMLPATVALAFVAGELLINQSALSSGFIATANHVPMHVSYGLTAGITIGAQLLLVGPCGWGLWALFLPPLLVTLAYNGWVWFRRSAQELDLSTSNLVAQVMRCGR